MIEPSQEEEERPNGMRREKCKNQTRLNHAHRHDIAPASLRSALWWQTARSTPRNSKHPAFRPLAEQHKRLSCNNRGMRQKFMRVNPAKSGQLRDKKNKTAYATPKRLNVSTPQLARIPSHSSLFAGGMSTGGHRPPLHRLGTWSRTSPDSQLLTSSTLNLSGPVAPSRG
jgi:hypothetical protein